MTPAQAQSEVRDLASGRVLEKTSTKTTLSSPRAGSTISAQATVGSYQCVTKTEQNSNFRGYNPISYNQSGRSYSNQWTFNPYSVDYARYISGYWTFQYEVCATGGGTAWNSWHTWYNGSWILTGQSGPRRV